MYKLYTLAFLSLSVCFFACGDDDAANGNCSCETNAVEFQVGGGQVYMPNIFSPNGDGINDLFYPLASSDIEEIESFLVENKNGGELYSGFNIPPNAVGFSWDGTSNNEIFEGEFRFTVKARNANGDVVEFSGTACSFPCDGQGSVTNLENCKWAAQHDGEGGFDMNAPSLEQLDCF